MSASGKVSVVVLMHNNVPMSQRCLEALSQAVADLDHEVILLDNASTEDTEPIRECASLFQRFRFLRSDENVPFSAANNRGASEASGRWLLFLNNDVFVGRESIKRLLAPLPEDKTIGITGARLLFPDERSVQHAGIGQMLWGYPSNYGVGAGPTDPRVRQRCERFALTGAMLCLPRDVFQEVGGFDERYIWGFEDIDLCLEIRSAGLGVVYEPEAVGIHVESATLKVTQKCDLNGNYRLYRQRWDRVLIPAEQSYVRGLTDRGIRRVAVFGTGMAARGMTKVLDENGIRIVAFTSSYTTGKGEAFLGRPVIPLAGLREERFDRLIVASQFFFEVEPMIRDFDPMHKPIYPLLM
jgi:GT2 family glycosyltransferase